jgi:hypothetical protein
LYRERWKNITLTSSAAPVSQTWRCVITVLNNQVIINSQPFFFPFVTFIYLSLPFSTSTFFLTLCSSFLSSCFILYYLKIFASWHIRFAFHSLLRFSIVLFVFTISFATFFPLSQIYRFLLSRCYSRQFTNMCFNHSSQHYGHEEWKPRVSAEKV